MRVQRIFPASFWQLLSILSITGAGQERPPTAVKSSAIGGKRQWNFNQIGWVRAQSAEAVLRQAGCWYRPITFPDGSRNLAVISGASAPMGCTISPPLATTASRVAATLSTMM